MRTEKKQGCHYNLLLNIYFMAQSMYRLGTIFVSVSVCVYEGLGCVFVNTRRREKQD